MNQKKIKQKLLIFLAVGLSVFTLQRHDGHLIFSKDSGFCLNGQTISITPPQKTDTIYYTLDGTPPSSTNGFLYVEPIKLTPNISKSAYFARDDFSLLPQYHPGSVDKAVILKAIAMDTSGKVIDTASKIYFVDTEFASLSQKYADIPILSIVGNPQDLFGYEDGILITGKDTDEWIGSYTDDQGLGFNEHLATLCENELQGFLVDYHIAANFNRTGKEAERLIQLDYFSNKDHLFSQLAGIRRRGKASSVGQQKGLNIYFREEYGGKQCVEDLFSNGVRPSRCSLKRPSAIYADAFISDLVRDRALIPLYYTPVSVFLQGEYWGTYCMYERWDKLFFLKHLGLEAVSIIKSGHSTDDDIASEEEFNGLIQYASKNDMSQDENYNYISNRIDIQSLIDHYCTRIFVDDIDSEEQYNVLVWKSTVNMHDGNEKWHWALYDIDSSFNDFTRNNTNVQIRDGRRGFLQHNLISGLLKNPHFKEQFVISFCDMINFNFSYEHTKKLFSEKVISIKDYLCYNEERFLGSVPFAKETVDSRTDHIMEFLHYRPKYIMESIQDALGLKKPVGVKVVLRGNSDRKTPIKINTSRIDINSSEHILHYFPNYAIRCSVLDDYQNSFKQWEIKHSNGQVDVYSSQSIEIVPEEGLVISYVQKS